MDETKNESAESPEQVGPLTKGAKPALTKEDVWEMRRLRRDEDKTLAELADKYGVSVGTVSSALYGEGIYRGV